MIHEYMWHGWGMGWSWLFGVVVLGLLIWIVVRNLRQNYRDYPSRGKTALDILKERYARGEINKEEFEEKKRGIT